MAKGKQQRSQVDADPQLRTPSIAGNGEPEAAAEIKASQSKNRWIGFVGDQVPEPAVLEAHERTFKRLLAVTEELQRRRGAED